MASLCKFVYKFNDLKFTGWQWVLRCLSRGELESLISVVLSHPHLLPPLYRNQALLRDPSAQLVLPTLLAGLEHVRLNKVSFVLSSRYIWVEMY